MNLRLLCVLAHPDDESLGMGGVVARYAAEGVATYLVTATSGEWGWPGAAEEHPGAHQLAQIREAELHAAAEVLGIRGLNLLRYPDGGLATASSEDVITRIAQAVRQIRPQVVITFGPDGATGHPDHIAICQLTTGALLCAADPAYRTAEREAAHRVAKLYYLAPTRAKLDMYDQIFGDSAMTVDGVRRRVPGWPEWSVSTRIDSTPYTQQVWRAISCHRSQLPILDALAGAPPATHETLFGTTTLYRVYSLVNAAHQDETDLFDGFR
ncbi:MAG: PIG-L family deacetylase, partial [Blastochloris sp.]|nr:PIG-L family deacetylase [Blastochloris sp.]